MLPYLNSVNLIRYLLVWRVNSSLAWLPRCLAAELSPVLGAIIAERLPTNEGRHWRKALTLWNESSNHTSRASQEMRKAPEAPWPIKAVLFVYPGKRTYGQGELILWELKLIGESADHGFFLEVILPAMEEAGYTSDPRWNRPNKLWGQFDIDSIYVARGPDWEPLVSDGRLDLRYRANPAQWAEGLTSELESGRFDSPTRLTWLTPFDLGGNSHGRPRKTKRKRPDEIPSLKIILDALLSRLSSLIPSLCSDPGDAGDILRSEEQSERGHPCPHNPSIQDVMEQADNVPILHEDLGTAPKSWPGRWIGTQIFSYIPPPVIPYLELASILHIGKQTHFGCGTFALIRSTSDLDSYPLQLV